MKYAWVLCLQKLKQNWKREGWLNFSFEYSPFLVRHSWRWIFFQKEVLSIHPQKTVEIFAECLFIRSLNWRHEPHKCMIIRTFVMFFFKCHISPFVDVWKYDSCLWYTCWHTQRSLWKTRELRRWKVCTFWGGTSMCLMAKNTMKAWTSR